MKDDHSHSTDNSMSSFVGWGAGGGRGEGRGGGVMDLVLALEIAFV